MFYLCIDSESQEKDSGKQKHSFSMINKYGLL